MIFTRIFQYWWQAVSNHDQGFRLTFEISQVWIRSNRRYKICVMFLIKLALQYQPRIGAQNPPTIYDQIVVRKSSNKIQCHDFRSYSSIFSKADSWQGRLCIAASYYTSCYIKHRYTVCIRWKTLENYVASKSMIWWFVKIIYINGCRLREVLKVQKQGDIQLFSLWVWGSLG